MIIEELKKLLGDDDELFDDDEFKKFLQYCEGISESVAEKIINIESSESVKDRICNDLIELVDRNKDDNKKNT